MKEERKRQKNLEANFEEEYFEDQGGGENTTVMLIWVCVSVYVCMQFSSAHPCEHVNYDMGEDIRPFYCILDVLFLALDARRCADAAAI